MVAAPRRNADLIMKLLIAWNLAHPLVEARLAPVGPTANVHLRDAVSRESLYEVEARLLAPDDEDVDEDGDVFSFFGVFTDLHRKAPAAGTPGALSTAPDDHLAKVRPVAPESEAGWENRFQWGLYYSAEALEATDSCPWTRDRHGSEGGVPAHMLRAEALLLAAGEAPADRREEKTAQRALRVYYHAKWLAERNHAHAAVYRFKQAAWLAKDSRRRLLAAHTLSRLGYFLLHWNRRDDARQYLVQSVQLTTRSNPLAPFLLGLIDREVAGADVKKLLEAEARIVNAGEQPSEDLQLKHATTLQDIYFWRAAEESPVHCIQAPSVPHFLTCVLTHAVDGMWQAARAR